MKNFRSTLVLAAFVALVAGFLALERHRPGTAEREQEDAVLFSVNPAKIDHLKITGPAGTVALERTGSVWRIVQPIQTSADRKSVENVLRRLQAVPVRRTILFSEIPRGAETLQQWNLVPGNSRVEFSGPGFSDAVVFGRKTAVSDLVYARGVHGPGEREAEAPVRLVPLAAQDDLVRALADLRSHAVFPAEAAKQASRFGVRVAEAAAPVDYEVVREESGWKFQKPFAAPANPRRAADWLGRLGGLQVRQFVADDAANLSAYGLSSPASQLWLTPAEGKGPETLLIGLPVPDAPGEVYAKRPDNAVVTLDAAAVDALLRDLPETRDRRLLPFAPEAATALRIDLPRFDAKDAKAKPDGKAVAAAAPLSLDLRREGADWVFLSPLSSGGLLDPAKADALLRSLAALEAGEVASDTETDLAPYGLDHPTGRIVVTLKKPQAKAKAETPEATASAAALAAGEKEETLTLLLGRLDPKGRLYAKNSRSGTLYLLDPALFNPFPRDPAAWLGAKVVADHPPELITSVAVVFESAPPFTVTRQGDAYTADRTGASVDPAKAGLLWDTAARLRAARWLGQPQPAYGLIKPRGRVRVGGSAPYVLLIGAPLPSGGRAAQVEGQPLAFVLSDPDVAIFTSPPFASVPAAPAPVPAPAKGK